MIITPKGLCSIACASSLDSDDSAGFGVITNFLGSCGGVWSCLGPNTRQILVLKPYPASCTVAWTNRTLPKSRFCPVYPNKYLKKIAVSLVLQAHKAPKSIAFRLTAATLVSVVFSSKATIVKLAYRIVRSRVGCGHPDHASHTVCIVYFSPCAVGSVAARGPAASRC